MAMRDEDPEVAAEKAARLQVILKRIEQARREIQKGEARSDAVKATDISDVVSVLFTPNHNLGYIVLSSIVSYLRELWSTDSPASKALPVEEQTEKIAALLYPVLDERMRETDADTLYPTMWLVQIVLQIDAAVGGKVILRDGMAEWLEDLSDLFEPSSLPIRYKCITLSLASGIPSCRLMIISRFLPWLQQQARRSPDLLARSSAAVALTKLSRAIDSARDTPEEGLWDPHGGKGTMDDDRRQKFAEDEELTELMKGLVVSGSSAAQDSSPAIDAVEGLAYLSDDKSLKEGLADDTVFLEHLLSLIPTPRKHNNLIAREIDEAPQGQTSTALMYGVATIVYNLVSYPPVLTEEQTQIAKLRQMAQPRSKGTDGKIQDLSSNTAEQEQESDEVVAKRGAKLIKAGVIPVLNTISRAESNFTRLAAAKAYLALTQARKHRGAMLQQGAGKALRLLCRTGTLRWVEGIPVPPLLTGVLSQDFARRTKDDLIALQALAKLAITTEPRLLFGTQEAEMVDACAPFQLLLLHPNSSLLQQFEALMALTNLASVSAAVAAKITSIKEIPSKLEVLMLDDNEMIRRAAVELTCNTITTDGLLSRYGGAPPEPTTPTADANTPSDAVSKRYLDDLSSPSPSALIARLHVLLGLSDVEDRPTQLAASGTLATLLSISPAACKALLSIKKGPSGVFAILGDLIDPRRVLNRADDDSEDGGSPTDSTESAGKKETVTITQSASGSVKRPAAVLSSVAEPSYTAGELLQLAHRGVVCVWDLISTVSGTPQIGIPEEKLVKAAQDEGLALALVALVKPLMASDTAKSQPATRQIIMTAAQSLKWLSDKGVEVS